ncbi:MAG: LptF/LptG family permease [Verrucomicrobiae bacterium]|nr:LptF/LptG family permease [Verrucomicrobiae bacterium]
MAITLFFALAVFSFVLLLGRALKKLSEMLVNRHVSLDSIGMFLFLLLPYVLSFTLPMALLAATLLVFGRMSADNEITAMRASGISPARIAAPVILLAVALMGVSLYINTTLQPRCRLEFRRLFLHVSTHQPEALLEEKTYVKDFPGYVIYVGRKNRNVLEDVTVYALGDSGHVTASLRAQRGIIRGNPQQRKVRLDLYQVRGEVRDPKDPTDPRKIRPGITAEHYPLELDVGAIFRQTLSVRQLNDLQMPELLAEIRNLQAKGLFPAAALMEMHHRIAAAVACVAFALIGIPLGIRTSRRETSVGIAISLGLSVLYYFAMVLANGLRDKPHLFPEAILWTPNLVFQLLGLWLLWRLSRG